MSAPRDTNVRRVDEAARVHALREAMVHELRESGWIRSDQVADGQACLHTERGNAVELHSEIESYRKVLEFQTPDGQLATVIVMRRRSAVWLTFNGAEKTTVVMGDQDAGQLIDAITHACGSRQ